jgi:Tol biopolymer transport system component
MSVDGGNSQNLTQNRAQDRDASWSPDGRKIIFVSGRDDLNAELYVMNRNGGNVVRLTHNQASDASASWFDPRFPVSEQKQLRTLWGALKRKP